MTFKDQIKKYNLPKFILFKNLKFNEGCLDFDISNIKSGEVIASNDYYSTLIQQVLKPKYPSTIDKQQLFEDKYGDREGVEFSFNTSPYAIIDIDPMDVEATPDFNIFDESYTILWVCPADIEQTVKVLLKHTKELVKSKNSEVNSIVPVIWDEYINKISVATDNEDFDLPNFVQSVKLKYENKLSNAVS